MIEPIDLYRGELGPIEGAEACERAAALAGGRPLYILAYTPGFCGFVTLKDGALVALDGPKRDKFRASDLFELRCFCDLFELRWAREGERGRAVVLRDAERGAPGQIEGLEMSRSEGAFFKRTGRYVLWGKGTRGGGTRLFEHRVGELPVPIEVPDKGRVQLGSIEYFREDGHGNKVWYAERLTGLSPLTSKPGAQPQRS